MHTLLKISLAALLALTLATPALAGSHGHGQGHGKHFDDMDMNGDELVDLNEFLAAYPRASKDDFHIISGGSDGFDHDQWHDFKESHGKAHGGHGGDCPHLQGDKV